MSGNTESSIATADQWVSNVIEKARDKNPLVVEKVLDNIEQLLKGQLSQQKLTPTTLKSLATQLLEGPVHSQPELGGENED